MIIMAFGAQVLNDLVFGPSGKYRSLVLALPCCPESTGARSSYLVQICVHTRVIGKDPRLRALAKEP